MEAHLEKLEAEGRLTRRSSSRERDRPQGRDRVGRCSAGWRRRRPPASGGSSCAARRPRTEGTIRRRGARRARSRSAATAGGCRTSRAADPARPLVRAGLLPGAGPALAARPLPPRGAAAGSPRSPDRPGFRRTGSCAPSACAARGSARRRSSIPSCGPTSRRWPPGINAAAEAAPAPAVWSCSCCALEFRAVDRRRLPRDAEAPLVRALDQLGARAPASRPGARARPGAGGEARPQLPAGQSAGPDAGDPRRCRHRARRAGGLDPPVPGDGGRGDGLEQLGRGAVAVGHRRRADRRATRTSRRRCPGSPTRWPFAWATGSAVARRCPARRGWPSATTTTSPGRSRTRWPTSWTCSSSGSRATATCSRTSGATSWPSRRRSTVRGHDAVKLVARETHHGPIVNEALRADESEPLALAWMSRS